MSHSTHNTDALHVPLLFIVPAPRTWSDLVRLDPRLQRFADAVAGTFGRDESEWVRLKKLIYPLVGWGSRSGPLATSDAWDIATRELRRRFERRRGGSRK